MGSSLGEGLCQAALKLFHPPRWSCERGPTRLNRLPHRADLDWGRADQSRSFVRTILLQCLEAPRGGLYRRSINRGWRVMGGDWWPQYTQRPAESAFLQRDICITQPVRLKTVQNKKHLEKQDPLGWWLQNGFPQMETGTDRRIWCRLRAKGRDLLDRRRVRQKFRYNYSLHDAARWWDS